jgi:mono/diheme cytochrome c family protein
MSIRHTVLFVGLFLAAFAVSTSGKPAADQNQLPLSYMPPGDLMFRQYCAACHGADAKGHGPARAPFKLPAADLTTLAKRHGGKFPYEYVTGVLRFGPGVPSHGSADMPTWGPIFEYLDNHNEGSVEQRIKNLCEYLSTLQER